MSNITMFNALIRQLLIHLGDEEGSHIIMNALNTKRKIKVLRALVFNDKTSRQIIEATGIPKTTFHHTLNKLVELGVVESKGKVRRPPKKGGPNGNLWGLV